MQPVGNWLLISLMGLGSSCVAYNHPCQPLVDHPEEPIGYLAEEVLLDKPNTRHANNAIAQMAADAYLDAFTSTGDTVQLAVVNGGSIRAEGLCVTRNVLSTRERMTRGLLHEIILFENLIRAVDLTEPEVVAMLEHSVSKLVPKGQDISSPAGLFLHLSAGTQASIDCTRPPGTRVTALTLAGEQVPIGNPRGSRKYRVAMSSFLLEGGDGYSMLVGPGTDPSRNPAQAPSFGGRDNAITAEYMKRTYNRAPEDGLRLDRTRLKLLECAVPARPQG